MPTRPFNPSVTLVHINFGDLVQVQGLEEPPVTGAGAPLELREGEVVQCLRNDGDGVLIARSDGSRILVPLEGARKVGILWFPDSVETEELAGGLPGGSESGSEGETRRWLQGRNEIGV